MKNEQLKTNENSCIKMERWRFHLFGQNAMIKVEKKTLSRLFSFTKMPSWKRRNTGHIKVDVLMFISVKHQRQQQEVKFWFPAIGAYQLLQARELVYRIDDLSSWTLHYIVSFNFRACKMIYLNLRAKLYVWQQRNYLVHWL